MEAPEKIVDTHALINGARIGRLHIIVAVLCAIILLVDGFNGRILGFVAPQIVKDWHLEHNVLGWIFSAGPAGNFFGFLVLAPLSGRFGLKRVALFCVVLFGAGEILASTAPNVPMLVFFRFITGAGLAAAIATAVALTGEFYPQRIRSTAITYMYIGVSMGGVCAGEAAQILIHHGYDWREILLVSGSLALVSVIPLALLLPESVEYLVNRGNRPLQAANIMRRLIRNADIPPDAKLIAGEKIVRKVSVWQLFEDGRTMRTLAFWLAIAMNLAVTASIDAWLPTMLVEDGLTQSAAIAIAELIPTAGVAAGLFIGPLMDRIGPFISIVMFFLIASCAALALGTVLSLEMVGFVGTAVFVMGFCTSGAQKGANALAVYFYPTALRSTAIGWVLGISRIAGAIGPLVIGQLLHNGWSDHHVVYAMSVPLLIAAFMLFLMGRPVKAAQA